jgi:hypothetical protein
VPAPAAWSVPAAAARSVPADGRPLRADRRAGLKRPGFQYLDTAKVTGWQTEGGW